MNTLTEDQKIKLANLFKEEIFPVIEENEESFNKMHEQATKLLDESALDFTNRGERIEMKNYELQTCLDLQHDIEKISNQVWDLETIYNMWSAWSDMCAAGWLGYQKGDTDMLDEILDILYDNLNSPQ